MSSTALILFSYGKEDSQIEYPNSWGGAARIWSSLFDKYVKDPYKPFDSWILGTRMEALCRLADRTDLPDFERAVHAFTFDLFYVKQDNFKQFAKHLRQFSEAYPVPGCVDHLPAWADVFEGYDAEAIGLYATSVGENLWCQYDRDKDEQIKTPLYEGHEVYETYHLATKQTQPVGH